jgi:hypothetical protein
MPKIAYTQKKFNQNHLRIIENANIIINEYAAQGYDLTLRQLYYQFVARDLLQNKQQNYKLLGTVVSDARRAGLIDWSRIVDRTRYLRDVTSWGSPEQIVAACADQFNVDFWANQDYRVEVWIEKDALIGVLEVACRQWRVPYFSCRGYCSDSESWAAAQRMDRYGREGKTPIVIHLGDHDPSGIDMTRDITDRVNLFARSASAIEVKRIALNMDQIEQYNPPPNPAKETDSRFAGYQERFGDESWELDALDPTTIGNLIAAEMRAIIDPAAWAASERERDAGREHLKAVSDNWDEVIQHLEEQHGGADDGEES